MWHCREQKLPFDLPSVPAACPQRNREKFLADLQRANLPGFQDHRTDHPVHDRNGAWGQTPKQGHMYERAWRLREDTLSDWLSPRCGPLVQRGLEAPGRIMPERRALLGPRRDTVHHQPSAP